MKRKTILKDASVLLITAILVSTTIFVFTPMTKALSPIAPISEYFLSPTTKGAAEPLPVIFTEDFSSGVPPTGWGTDAPAHWISSFTSYAGGTVPEAMFSWAPGETGEFRLYTFFIDTSGFTALSLSFKEFVNDFNGDYMLKVQTSSDGGVTWIDVYTRVGGPFGPATTSIILDTADGVGSPTFQIAWTFSGNSYNINYWYIDDVNLMSLPLPDLIIWTSSTSSIGDNQYNPPTFQTGGWIWRGLLQMCHIFSLEIQNDGSGPMSCTIQTTLVAGTVLPLGGGGRLYYIDNTGTLAWMGLNAGPNPMITINPGPGQGMILFVCKWPVSATNVVQVRLDVVTTTTPIEQDSVTVHT